MRPPYTLSEKVLQLITSISELIGEVNATHVDNPSPQLRKQNKIKTIHHSLKIEGNSLNEQQITALLENKSVIGPRKDVTEVLNAIKVYENLENFDFKKQESFLSAHKLLMGGLIENPGKYRTQGVGIVKGSKLEHLAPPVQNLKGLMNDLFKYLKEDKELILIKSCVFHYEMEFIHPFIDGNGRMGRLWQTLILMERYPVIQFIPFETIISQTQESYYEALAKSDKLGASTPFLEYMLSVIERSLQKMLHFTNKIMNASERLDYFIYSNKSAFSRKNYMNVFKNISTATASRDLKKGVELKLIKKIGNGNKTRYQAK